MDDSNRPHGFTTRMESRSLGSAIRGQEIMAGRLGPTGGDPAGDPFAEPARDAHHAAELHGFGWLDDLAAVGQPRARELAQGWVLGWIAAHPTPPQEPDGAVWRADTCGRRVLRWIFHAGQILPGLDRAAAQPVFDSLHAQLAFLARVEAPAGRARIEALSAQAIAAMRLRGAEAAVAPALDRLSGDAASSIAGPVMRSRCPEELSACLTLLGWVKDAAGDTGHDLPAEISRMIEEIAPMLRALRHADGGLPRFHGGGRGVAGRLDYGLRAATGPAATATGQIMGFARLARARATVMLDAAPPPAGPAATHAHASTLGMEFTSARHPVVISCGPGRMFGPDWARASRATACHSTLCLSGQSSARLLPPDSAGNERLTLLPQRVWAGACDEEGNLLPPDTPPPRLPQTVLAGHDGWQGSHGLSHLRELVLSPDGDALRGEDMLAALDEKSRAILDRILAAQGGVGFEIRFHLHPDVTVRTEGDAVTLHLPGETWCFRHDGVAALRLEPTAYLEAGQPEPLAATQIVLGHSLTEPAVQIGWTFIRAGAS
ncbi:Uncharacterized conserved protein, heparinase superfamily [Paracoccus isoporae]|uniref:Uncharacterized conserved protein, heparinase superfamily n=1 Tax=Paracoccus isoporae TaxID=591205 RepID=A0A1G6YRF9_9RHOB|nr:heparinase II/III family protein [Paracoccus isoporae]SDD92613.1 Uncharacterized conserved protein, heparinase superfamily [Paracoccus isoporae]